MQITGSIFPLTFNKFANAVISTVFSFPENQSALQEILAVAKILDLSNNIVLDTIPVSVSRVSRGYNALSSSIFYLECLTDISSQINSLNSETSYKFSVNAKLYSDGVLSSEQDSYQEFLVLAATPGININATHNEPVTAEIINQKFAAIAYPGVLHGMDITPGTGPNMYNIEPGAAVSKSGLKLTISETNFNIIKCNALPSTSFRIDAVCITDTGAVVNIPGVTGAGQGVIDESDKTVIGYFYLSSSMASVSEARVIKRMSLSKNIQAPRRRLYNQPMQALIGSVPEVFEINNYVDPETLVINKNGKRLSPADYIITPGAVTYVRITSAYVSGDIFTADFDLKISDMPSNQDILSHIMPASKLYPWDGAESLFRNAWLNTIRSNNIINAWTNIGSLLSNSGMIISKASAFSPDAILTQDNGMLLPMDDTNRVTGVISSPNCVKSPATFIIAFKFSQIRTGMLLSSNSNEAGPKFNYSINLQALPGNTRFEINHGGVSIYQSALANHKYVYAFRLDEFNNIAIFENGAKLLDTPAISTAGFNVFSEIYLKNELNPTIYFCGYWGTGMSDSDIINTSDAIISQQLV